MEKEAYLSYQDLRNQVLKKSYAEIELDIPKKTYEETAETFIEFTELGKNDKKPFHVTVAEKIIEQLEQGTAPWQKPWAMRYPPKMDRHHQRILQLHHLYH